VRESDKEEVREVEDDRTMNGSIGGVDVEISVSLGIGAEPNR
jgi:hypothetical protein